MITKLPSLLCVLFQPHFKIAWQTDLFAYENTLAMATSQVDQNSETFRDCLSAVVLEQYMVKSSTKPPSRPRRKAASSKSSGPNVENEDGVVDPSELSDFVEVYCFCLDTSEMPSQTNL